MAREVVVILSLVVPDPPPDTRVAVRNLRGRELAGVPGSLITRVAVHEQAALQSLLRHENDIPLAADTDETAGPVPGQLTFQELAQELEADYGEGTDSGD